MSTPANHDPTILLAKWWATHTTVDEDDDMRSADQRLAVTAASGAVALTATGWSGPANYDNDTAKFAAIVGDWDFWWG